MAAGILEGREILTTRLKNQLGTLVSSVGIAGQNNLSSSHVVAETTLAGLLNRVYGWELINANAIHLNYPGVDLIDEDRKIAVQVTATRKVEKVHHTLEEVGKSGIIYKQLIILTITHAAPTLGMLSCTVPTYSGPMEVWNISDVFRDAKELDIAKLEDITKYMAAELGPIKERVKDLPHLELPPTSALQATGFVGREEELSDIQSRFAKGDRLVILTGLGGMGKTELAVRYGREHPGLVYFVRFDKTFSRTLANMALGIRPKLTEDELRKKDDILIKKVQTLLERSSSEDLLIIDNADGEAGTLADLMKDAGYKTIQELPLKLLLTTRSDAPRAIQIKPMPEEPFFEIFRKHGAELTVEEMKDLIQAVNGHTLTVDLIARTLNGKGWRKVTAEKMLTALCENTLPSQKYRKIATDYNQSTEQAQIYEHLSVVFDVSGIPEAGQSVMRCATLLPDGGMDSECFGMSLNEDEQDALDALLVCGLLEVKNDLLTIHPVIRLVCRTELKPTDENCEPFLNTLIDQYDETVYHLDQYRQMAELLTNASTSLADTQGRWAMEASERWHDVGELAHAHTCSLCAMRKMEGILPPDAPELAQAYNNVGVTFGDLGKHQQALEYNQKALTIRKRVLSADHPDLAQSYNNVGTTYGHLGEHKKALEYLLKALEIPEKVLPPEHPDLATSYNNVGAIYGYLGDHKIALEYQQKALEIYQKVHPADHPDLALSYNNMGTTYRHLGDHKKALEYQLKALLILEKALPSEHPNLALSCNNIAWAYHDLGDFPAAAQYMRRAADIISRSSLPKTHPRWVNFPKWADDFEKKAKM